MSSSGEMKVQMEVPRFLGLKLYGPTVILVLLVLLAWIPHVRSLKSTADYTSGKTPNILTAWGPSQGGRFHGTVDTGSLLPQAQNYYLMLVLRVADAQVDQVLDEIIDKSDRFRITGEAVDMEVKLGEASFSRLSTMGISTMQYFAFIVPHSVDKGQIRRLADLYMLGGRLVGEGTHGIQQSKLPG